MTLRIAPVQEKDPFELLAPFRAWSPRRLPDPREATAARVGEGLAQIVASEGPVLDHRAFRLYTAAAGLSRATRPVVAVYRAALKRVLKAGTLSAEPDEDGAAPLVLRAAGAARLVVRERGDRTLDEIPHAEIAALIRKLELDRGEAVASEDERFRRLLGLYGLIRLTAKAKERLESARVRAGLPQWQKAISGTFEPEAPLVQAKARRTHRRLRHG